MVERVDVYDDLADSWDGILRAREADYVGGAVGQG